MTDPLDYVRHIAYALHMTTVQPEEFPASCLKPGETYIDPASGLRYRAEQVTERTDPHGRRWIDVERDQHGPVSYQPTTTLHIDDTPQPTDHDLFGDWTTPGRGL